MSESDNHGDNADLPPEDKLGFAIPKSPGHSLLLLNSYMRTDLLRSIHARLHDMKAAQAPGSPIHHLAQSLEWVLDIYGNTNLFECVSRNPYHIAPGFLFQAEEDYTHDVRLMKHHLKCHRRTIKDLVPDD